MDLFITVEIQLWSSDQHGRDLGRQITLERGAIYLQKIGDISLKNQLLIDITGDFPLKSPIYRRYITIFLGFFAKYPSSDFSSRNVVSPTPDTRYIGDISSIFHDIFLLGWIMSINCLTSWFTICLVSCASYTLVYLPWKIYHNNQYKSSI